MKKIAYFLALVLFLTALSYSQAMSPMYYKGVDAGMSPEEVIKILGKPQKIIGDDIYVYSIKGGGYFSIEFLGKLYKLRINYPTSIPYSEFGLESKGFGTFIDDDGRKTWMKLIKSRKYGEIAILYKSEPGYLNIINFKEMYISDMEVLGNWILE